MIMRAAITLTTLLFSSSLQSVYVDGLVLPPPSSITLSSMNRGRRGIVNDRFSHDWGITSPTPYNKMKRTAKIMMHRHTSSTTLYNSSSSQQQGGEDLTKQPTFVQNNASSTLPQLLESVWGLISRASQTMTRGVSYKLFVICMCCST